MTPIIDSTTQAEFTQGIRRDSKLVCTTSGAGRKDRMTWRSSSGRALSRSTALVGPPARFLVSSGRIICALTTAASTWLYPVSHCTDRILSFRSQYRGEARAGMTQVHHFTLVHCKVCKDTRIWKSRLNTNGRNLPWFKLQKVVKILWSGCWSTALYTSDL
jgi:hypothetical protein